MKDEMVMKLLNEIAELKEELKKREQEPLVLGTKELAKALDMSVNYAGMLMNNKTFPSMKLGGKWKVTKKALDEWLEHNRWHEIELE